MTNRIPLDLLEQHALEEMLKAGKEINKKVEEQENILLLTINPLDKQKILNKRLIKDFIFNL